MLGPYEKDNELPGFVEGGEFPDWMNIY